jgi:hypothetical protein
LPPSEQGDNATQDRDRERRCRPHRTVDSARVPKKTEA